MSDYLDTSAKFSGDGKYRWLLWRAENQDHVTQAGMIICAWGAHGAHLGQDETVLGWLGNRKRHALGLTKERMPRHPLYLPSNSIPFAYDGAA